MTTDAYVQFHDDASQEQRNRIANWLRGSDGIEVREVDDPNSDDDLEVEVEE